MKCSILRPPDAYSKNPTCFPKVDIIDNVLGELGLVQDEPTGVIEQTSATFLLRVRGI